MKLIFELSYFRPAYRTNRRGVHQNLAAYAATVGKKAETILMVIKLRHYLMNTGVLKLVIKGTGGAHQISSLKLDLWIDSVVLPTEENLILMPVSV